jgi:hypothetical protein
MADKTITVSIDGENIQTTSDALARAFCERKARPEALWLSGALRYVERGYVEGPGGTYSPAFIVVTEQNPGVRTCNVQNNFDGAGGSSYGGAAYKTHRLAFPFIVNVFVFKVTPDGVIVLDRAWPLSFYRTMPIRDFADELYICNLPNVRIDPWNDSANKAAIGWTCYHNAPANKTQMKPYPATSGKTGESDVSALSRLTEQVLTYYWESAFTGSAGAITAWKATAQAIPQMASVKAWEEATASDPNFVLNLPWLPHPEGASIGDVILSIREATMFLPHEGWENGEDKVFAPGGAVSNKRLKAIVKNAANLSNKLKYF